MLPPQRWIRAPIPLKLPLRGVATSKRPARSASRNEALNTPNSPQGTPGAPPERATSQKGFPNSMFDGLGLILDGFWKDIVAEPSH